MASQAPQCTGQVAETLLVASDTAAAPVGVDRGRWQQSLHTLCERITSAGREIERCLEIIVLRRRRPTERNELLHLVPHSKITPRTSLGTDAARQIIAQWRRRVRIRNELIRLSNGDLRDIGWTRAEVEAECRKPFWRA